MRFTEAIGFLTAAFGFMVCNSSAQEAAVSGIQVLGISAEGEGLSEERRQQLAETTASSFSFVSPGGSFSFGSPGAGLDPNNRSQLFNLLANESVRQELGLTEAQVDGVKKITQEAQKRLTQMVRAKMAAQRSEGGATRISLGGGDLQEIMQENQAVAEEAIEEILLPTQLERVRQLAYQVRVSQEGLGEALVNGRLGAEIGVHDDQKQHLTDRAAKIEEQARIAILRIKAAARAELLMELTPDQRQAAEKLLGDYFEYEELSFGQQIRNSMKTLNVQPDQE